MGSGDRWGGAYDQIRLVGSAHVSWKEGRCLETSRGSRERRGGRAGVGVGVGVGVEGDMSLWERSVVCCVSEGGMKQKVVGSRWGS